MRFLWVEGKGTSREEDSAPKLCCQTWPPLTRYHWKWPSLEMRVAVLHFSLAYAQWQLFPGTIAQAHTFSLQRDLGILGRIFSSAENRTEKPVHWRLDFEIVCFPQSKCWVLKHTQYAEMINSAWHFRFFLELRVKPRYLWNVGKH